MPHDNEYLDDEVVDLITDFRIDLIRINIPVTVEYPSGEGVILKIMSVNNIVGGPKPKHYLMPPDAAKGIGSGLVEVADEAKGTGLVVPQ